MLAFQTVLGAVWLLLAVCHLAQLSCTTGQAEQCKAAWTAPETKLAGQGFDVVTMKRTQAYVIDVNTYLKKPPPLHPMFVQSIMNLPQQYNNQTKPDYIKFLATFGTHYTHKVDLGGRVKSVTSVQMCKAALDGYTEMEVRICLNAEAAARASVKSAEIKAQAEYCRNALKRYQNMKSFSRTFKQRFTQVVGGYSGNISNLHFSAKVKPNTFRKSLRIKPEIISYGLHPLYQLVKDPVKKKAVKKATEDYILQHALIKYCSNKCTQGSTPSSHDPCTCRPIRCITDNCCPQRRGVAHFTVTVKHASGLWGDVFSQTDGFVRVLGNQTFQTKVIHNNNNPQWNEDFYLGTVELPLKTELKLEVWDEDNHWYDRANDLLGSCTKSVRAGSFTSMCPMKHGNLYFSYKAECAPGLRGATCSEYSPFRMKVDLLDLYSSRNSLNVNQDLLVHLKGGHTVDDPLTFVMRGNKEMDVQAHLPLLSEL
ncbi:perforin-1-like [Thunnus albacares]|uniref:perforin-1-like n=1 Tax=Thunnus albacares TaxID=8236 RepID=UPI001CF6541E|nr:perforin-1-like [Thunnus albacares]